MAALVMGVIGDAGLLRLPRHHSRCDRDRHDHGDAGGAAEPSAPTVPRRVNRHVRQKTKSPGGEDRRALSVAWGGRRASGDGLLLQADEAPRRHRARGRSSEKEFPLPRTACPSRRALHLDDAALAGNETKFASGLGGGILRIIEIEHTACRGRCRRRSPQRDP